MDPRIPRLDADWLWNPQDPRIPRLDADWLWNPQDPLPKWILTREPYLEFRNWNKSTQIFVAARALSDSLMLHCGDMCAGSYTARGLQKHNIIKKRIDQHGNIIETRVDGIGSPKIENPLQRHGGRLEHNETYCGSCFGAEASDEDCCNSCEEVREAYRKKGWALTNPDLIDQCKREGFLQKIKEEEGEGCNIYGSLEVNKVAGNFHFAPGKSFQHSNMHVHDLLAFQKETFNVSHKIHKLSFGAHFPGVVNPLDGVEQGQQTSTGMYQYFLKVVPTVYTDIRGHKILSNQFSVTEHFKAAEIGLTRSLPGVFFFYDLSPIKVQFTEQRTPFLHFLTNVCAIVGGIFTVSGIIDSFIYHGHRAIKKKIEIGKFS